MRFFFDNKANLKPIGRQITWFLVCIYLLAVCYMCFSPQHPVDSVETPNIQHFGRLVVLLVPFNSFFSIGQLTSPLAFFWVIGQNIANVFLLFPLILGLLALFPKLRTTKYVLELTFLMSLSIEMIQLIIDLSFDANRVFEIDDLWTNTLGGLLALIYFKWLTKRLKK